MAVYRNQVGTIEINEQFYQDVVQGLLSHPQHLQSKYFYDEEGDRLFQQIMQLPEYYLTRCEREILVMQKKEMAAMLVQGFEQFDVLELGAGDATKSTYLLRQLREDGDEFSYYPIDISENIIQQLNAEMPQRIEGLQVQGLSGDYFEMIHRSYEISKRPKVVLFLGATIGNYTPEQALEFLQLLNQQLKGGDKLVIGFDLKKNPKRILSAYNDSSGVTRAFNLNLLHRINRELMANFNVDNFDHYPTYDPETGACKSYLVSLADQDVTIYEEKFHFEKNDYIWTELSQKYSEHDVNELALESGFVPVENFYDSRHWYLDAVWKKR